MVSAELFDALQIARKAWGICPRPKAWAAFGLLLQARRARSSATPPRFPASLLASWPITDDDFKAQRFRQQLRWAEQAGLLTVASRFLTELPASEWYRMPEDLVSWLLPGP